MHSESFKVYKIYFKNNLFATNDTLNNCLEKFRKV